jgi:hypothetical protein
MLNSHKKNIVETLGRNTIHPFPARMAPGIALEALGKSEAPLRVLDPMTGSGTVLAVARARGHRAFGMDLDPLAVLLAKVWTRTINREQIRKKAEEVLARARARFRLLPVGRAYPIASDHETQKFIRYWFDGYARRQLAALAEVIGRIDEDATREALWAAFSRLIITKQAGASLAMDLSHSRPHRRFRRAPTKPFNRFLSAVETIVLNCPRFGSEKVGPPSIVKLGDARGLSIESGSIDLVITSPPYLNAIDYMRCSKFSLVWMGYKVSELRLIRANSIGAELRTKEAMQATWVHRLLKDLRLRPTLSNRDYALLVRYVWDMGHALAETNRVLRHGARAVYVVGDSTNRGTFIPNSLIVSAVAQLHGLCLVSRQSRILPAGRRYLPPPKRSVSSQMMDSRIRKEVVIAFRKPY